MKKILVVIILTILLCVNNYAQNQVLSLDGDGDYLSIPSANILNTVNEITISTWIKPNLIEEGWHSLVNKWWDGSYRGYEIAISDDRIVFDLSIDWENNDHLLWSDITLNADIWYFVSATYDGSEMKLYINDETPTNQAL